MSAGHSHSHDHRPAHGRTDYGRAFAIGIGLNLGFVIVETVFGCIKETLESGELQLVVTGRNLLGAPGGGLTLTIGRLTLVLDEGSGLFLPVGEATGRVIDLCPLLA